LRQQEQKKTKGGNRVGDYGEEKKKWRQFEATGAEENKGRQQG
jgi:hypothetical protein